MSDKRVVDEIITKFVLNTCRLHPQIGARAVQAAEACAAESTTRPPEDNDAEFVPLTTGSVAEFYVEPMLSCVGDVDVMYHSNAELAIPAGQSPPTQLPDEFHNYVKVTEIVQSYWPGYVYLQLRYLLTACMDDEKYIAVEYDTRNYNIHGLTVPDTEMHGPAMFESVTNQWKLDRVRCVRCLSWPPQAADWPTRHRCHDWPDSATVSRVVRNGCDVVRVAHRQCREDERMARCQWRLSFSRAEIVLLNSWTPVQQIAYHLLRIFAKTEQLTDRPDNCEPRPLSNYHIKTLMLWACELKPLRWWTEDISFVRICADLLHIIGDWLTDARCPHYFVGACNLIDSSLNVKDISSKLTSIQEAWLSTWLVNNYIDRCSKLCPDSVSRQFDDVSSIAKLQQAVSAVEYWRLNHNALLDLWDAFEDAEFYMACVISVHECCLTVGSYKCCMSEFCKLDIRFSLFFKAATLLFVSFNVATKNACDDRLMDVLATLVGQFTCTTRYSNQCSSDVCLSKAAKLMKAVASKSLSTGQLIEIELSKAYLHKALRCEDSGSDSIYCLANVYLAVLYYTTGQYQTAIDHCTLVTRSRDHSQCSSRVVQGELLPQSDDDINSALGLTDLYEYVLTASLNQRQLTKYLRFFTTELFAHYLHARCDQVANSRHFTQTSFAVNIQQYERCLCDTHELLCVADLLLFKLKHKSSEYHFHWKPARRRCREIATNPTELNTSKLVELLQKSAVEHLTTYREVVSRDFSSVATVVMTDVRALYEYKRGNYRRCLELSTQNAQTLLLAPGRAAVFPTLPIFIQLLDDDVVSLIALATILDPETRYWSRCSCETQLTLSLYLMTQCQLKLRHSVTSLVQTVRCITLAQYRHGPIGQVVATLNQLTLKLARRLALTYLAKFVREVRV